MRRAVLVALTLFAAALLSGCGDEALWARWQAERGLFHARAAAARLPSHAVDDAALRAAEARALRVMEQFPPSRWAADPAARGAARQVGVASGRAALLLAELADRRDADSLAVERLRAVLGDYAALPAITIPARLSLAHALQRLGRFDEALAVRQEVVALDPMVDPDRRGPSPEVVETALLVAHELRRRDLPEQAEQELSGVAARYSQALARARGRDSLVLSDALALLHVTRGDAPSALAVGRAALAAAPAWERSGRLLVMAQGALDAGAPDSAVVYARWAATAGGSRRVTGLALMAAAQAWEALGEGDSAITAYDAVLRRWADPGVLGAPAHFQRARLLERRGDWLNANAEYNALVASQPSHPLSFLAAQRIVRHHLNAGETELARVQGEQVIDNLTHLLASYRDDGVQRQASLVRADLLLELGRIADAESSLVALWRRFPGDSATEDGALRAARLGAHLPGGRERSTRVLVELSRLAADPVVRRSAAAALQSAASDD